MSFDAEYVHQLINLEYEEFLALISNLSPALQVRGREIRRLGRNNLAQRRCRGKKVEKVEGLRLSLEVSQQLGVRRQRQLEMAREEHRALIEESVIAANEYLLMMGFDPHRFTIQWLDESRQRAEICPLPLDGREPELTLRGVPGERY